MTLSVLRKSLRTTPSGMPVVEAPNSRFEAPEQPIRTLLMPLIHLLAGGSDARLSADPVDGLDKYGCQLSPRPAAMTFASSTATSISNQAYLRADRARGALIRAALNVGLPRAFDLRCEHLRRELKLHLELKDADAEIVFSPSGTDAQLNALFIARSLLGSETISLVVGADETGGGTAYSAVGRHFTWRTAQGTAVKKGAPIFGLATDRPSIDVALRDERGQVRAADTIDKEVIDAIVHAVGDGRKVLLHVMDRSKLGLRAPSQECLNEISQRWPVSVQIVIDACQGRLGRARIRSYLGAGYLVLLTGSKFFTGPPFSGALFVPRPLSEALRAIEVVPSGLRDYTNRSDWPALWRGIRSRLPARMNFGQWLRWEAALEEIHNYFAVPASYRKAILQNFSSTVHQLIARSPSLNMIQDQTPDPSDTIDDEEMSVRTISPFIVRRQGTALSLEECTILYRALNRDISCLLPSFATTHEKWLAAQLCHIGQPVALHDHDGGETAALRISASARLVSDSWSPNEELGNARAAKELDGIATAFAKIEVLIKYFSIDESRLSPRPRNIFDRGIMTTGNLLNYQEQHDTRPIRIGVAKLARMAFDGFDLGPLWNDLLKEVAEGDANAAAVMDMSVIAQLLGDKKNGLALQTAALDIERLYRLPCSVIRPRLRVLALVAPIDLGGNTPIEFLLEGSDIELYTLYIVPGKRLPAQLPAHDIAFVAVPDLDETQAVLAEIDQLIPSWPNPVLNLPQRIAWLNRERLCDLLKSVAGLDIPITSRISRNGLSAIGLQLAPLSDSLQDAQFPLIVRPVDSHAGRGLAKIDEPADIAEYLRRNPEEDFFISRYVDYRSQDGLFRKYRIAFVDGRPYACHMAISDQWKIWYLNADMAASAEKRAEEERFMTTFNGAFVERHNAALNETAKRVGLEYFAIDCAETMSGKLLIFEGESVMIVHNMDSPETFPYKAPQMRKIFEAFATMLYRYSKVPNTCAT